MLLGVSSCLNHNSPGDWALKHVALELHMVQNGMVDTEKISVKKHMLKL